MAKTILCQKLNETLPALQEAPFPGPLGERIFSSISQKAWDLWIEEQTKIINENKLQLFKKEARDLLKSEAEKFLFS